MGLGDPRVKTEDNKARESLYSYATSFFQRKGRDIFQGLGVAIGLPHWLALCTIYMDLARPWGKKGRVRLGTPDGEAWVSVDDMTSLFGIQRARSTLQTALRLCKALQDYLTDTRGDWKGHFEAYATGLYETAQKNYAKATVTINALYKAAKADPNLRGYLTVKPPDWLARGSALYNYLIKRLQAVGLSAADLAERDAKSALTVADAAFLFLDAGHLNGLAKAVEDAAIRFLEVSSFEERQAVANKLLAVAIAQAEADEGLVDQLNSAIGAHEGEAGQETALAHQEARV